jgi:hypothetical protein
MEVPAPRRLSFYATQFYGRHSPSAAEVLSAPEAHYQLFQERVKRQKTLAAQIRVKPGFSCRAGPQSPAARATAEVRARRGWQLYIQGCVDFDRRNQPPKVRLEKLYSQAMARRRVLNFDIEASLREGQEREEEHRIARECGPGAMLHVMRTRTTRTH